MRTINCLILLCLLVWGSVHAQSNLPTCQGIEVSRWTNCFGSVVYAKGNKYVGEFKDGKFNGQGTFFYLANDQFKDHRYVGDFKDGKRNGQGTFTLANGDKYAGAFKDEKRNGQGTFTLANGIKYVGAWKDDKSHGLGAIFASNGSVTNEGIWNNGEFIGSEKVEGANFTNQTEIKYKSSHILLESASEAAHLYQELQAAQGNKIIKFRDLAIRFSKDPSSGKNGGQLGWEPKGTFVPEYERVAADLKVGEFSMPFKTQFGWHLMYMEDKEELTQFAPTNAQEPTVASSQPSSAERDSLTADVEAERKKRQELEQQLAAAKERERITAELDHERKKRQELEAQLAASVQPTPPLTNAPRRIAHALVIGNGAYPGSGRLDNPVNDANAISQKLRSMGFTVTTVTDANRQRLVQSMAQFRRSAASADISLLYYAGHGVQIFGTNYILPTDVDQTDPAQATIQGVSLNSVVENFLPGKTKLVFLDACRDNALQRTNDRSVSKGLAPISAAEGTLISYATKDGQTASDGMGSKNSPFTQALLEHLSDPQDIAVVLRKVRERVMKITGGKQQPWEYGSLTGGELVLSAINPK